MAGESGSREVRIKRTSEDTLADDAAYFRFMGRACGLGDREACTLQRAAADPFVASVESLRDASLRSSLETSALYLFQRAAAPAVVERFSAVRQGCLAGQGGCYWAGEPLYAVERLAAAPSALPEGRASAALDAVKKSLDFGSIELLLDKEGYPPALLAPLRAAVAEVLVEACLEGACVCGDAAREVGEDDPRHAELARLGCDDGEAEGCHALSRLHETGRGAPLDRALAVGLYEQACPPRRPGWDRYGPRLGETSPRACERLAELYDAGDGVPKDRAVAEYYAELACQRPGYERDHGPCVRLARFWVPPILRETCSVTECAWTYERARANLHGPTSDPVKAKECERPSVAGLCAAHAAEIEPLPKPKK